MCSRYDDPSVIEAETIAAAVEAAREKRARGCENPLWMGGRVRPCGSSSGLVTWTDSAGAEHRACRWHVGIMQRRWPAEALAGDPLRRAHAAHLAVVRDTQDADVAAVLERLVLPRGWRIEARPLRRFEMRSQWGVWLYHGDDEVTALRTYDPVERIHRFHQSAWAETVKSV